MCSEILGRRQYLNTQWSATKVKRIYTLRRRAQQQENTRRKIVEAAVELHGSLGPGRTTFSMVAERAGVQRHTLYAHFPDERSLYLACSGLAFERDPLPDPAAWRAIADQRKRLRAGLRAMYDWYARNAALVACALRDAEYHPLTREMAQLRFGPQLETYYEVLGKGLTARQKLMLRVALSFFTWRTLAQESGLTQSASVTLTVKAITCQDHRD
jgi:AcrR family transcriptional regulator